MRGAASLVTDDAAGDQATDETGGGTGEPATVDAQPAPADAGSGGLPGDIRVYWKNGLRMETQDRAFRFKIGGRLQHDSWFVLNEEKDLEDALGGSQEDGTTFRRARIHMTGTLWENTIFKWAYEFAGGDVSFKDAFFGWEDLSVVGALLVGQQKEPIGLEWAQSSNWLTFIERGLPHALNPERSTGVRVGNTAADDAVYLTAGLYRPSSDRLGGTAVGDDWVATARASWVPIFEGSGERLLHLGASGSYRSVDLYAAGSRPENIGLPVYAAAALTDVDHVGVGGLELATNLGPVSLQGEYIVSRADLEGSGGTSWYGWYAYVSWFLTGEHRPYRRDRGAFKPIVPDRNMGSDGKGAWEVAARYSSLDLDDTDNTTGGGAMEDVTLGVNWYLNPATRIMANYIRADLEGVGASDSLLMRFQIFF